MTALTVPQLSLAMEEARVLRWLVPDGATVEAGQPVVEIETDKATLEMEAPAAGVLRVLVAEGTTVAVEVALAEIGESPPGRAAMAEPVGAAHRSASVTMPPRRPRGRHTASPAARRVARERGIELGSVQGSGTGGRITVRDLAPRPAARVPDALRQAVVANLVASWHEIPHVHIGGELVADGLAAATHTAASLPSVDRPAITDLLLLALTQALADVPDLNGTVVHGQPRRSERISIALAVATTSGVVAPVLRDAGSLELSEIAAERQRLVSAARAGSLEGRDLVGATCTLSNLGTHPVDFFVPIVTGPQIATIAVGRVAEKPVAVDGMLTVGHRLWVNAALDHRAADGEAGGRFLAAFEHRLADLPHAGGR
jgi:pyruvate dehydrogenase E2 component (dihydrolipoamide acetyltransferase)